MVTGVDACLYAHLYRGMYKNSLSVHRVPASSRVEFQFTLGRCDRSGTPPTIAKDGKEMTTKSFCTATPYRAFVALALLASAGLGLGAPAAAQAQYRNEIRNEMGRCQSDRGPALLVTVEGIKSSQGNLRVQSYRATSGEWLTKGKWLSRIEVPARGGSMTFCVPVPSSGTYGVAVRHDVNGNGETDIATDGGGMSNNPAITIFNLGKPSYTKVGVAVGDGVKSIRIQMKYM